MKKKKVIGIWVEHPFQLYTAKPIIDKYIKDNKVILLTTIKDIELCNSYTGIDKESIVNINLLKKKWQFYAKTFFELVLVPTNFSIVYRHNYVNKEPKLYRFIRFFFFLKLKKQNVNKYFLRYRKMLKYLGLYSKFPFQLDLLISITKVNAPFLIPFDIPHISIMESWDHPMKLPYYINPDFNLTWNKDLKVDTKYFQNLKKIYQIYPLKFRYIYDRLTVSNEEIETSISNQTYLRELHLLKGKDIVMYPTTTSSIGIYHEGEMDVIDDLCQAIQNTGKTLYIKPKPNGPKGDYDEFCKYENVIVGMYASNPDSRDMLNEEYHSFRYLLLKYSNMVVNVGTTFGLEAAIADKRLLQLDLQTDKYGSFTDFSKTYHLEKYILNSEHTYKYNGNVNLLREAILNTNDAFKDYIKNWITDW